MQKTYAVGIGLNRFDARAIILSSDGKVMAQVAKKRAASTVNEIIADLLELTENIFAKAQDHHEHIKKIGVALGGIIDSTKGIVYWPEGHEASYAHVSVPFKSYLEKKYKMPVVIENDANACAWAEYAKHFSSQASVLYMFSGVGCGIIADGRLYKGKNGGAGEVFLHSSKPMRSSLGDFSFLKQWPADLGMVSRAKKLISLGRHSSLIKKITPTGELPLADIFGEAKKRDKLAREVVKEAAFCLGAKIAFLVNLFDPHAVVIGGGLEEAGEFFLEECVNSVKDFSFSEMTRDLKINFSQLGLDAVSLGAALLALESGS